jgi:predicted Zn-dependent peptidase
MAVSFQQRTLSNGLSIVAEVDAAAHTAAAGFFVRTGARDEAGPVMGVSHFLEHMMFKGTGEMSAEALNRRFDELGARNNAFTSNEMTCFYAHVLPERLEDCVDLLGHMLRPALRDEDFATEKGVILEEIAMYMDNPFWLLFEATVEKHYAGHPLSHRILGTPETITNLSRDAMRDYFDQRYSADNTVVALAGQLDFDRVCDRIERACGDWRRTGVSRNGHLPRPGGGEFVLRNEKVNRAYLLGLAPAPAFADERRHAAGLLAQILGNPENSRFYWALIEPGIAEEAQASFDPHDGIGQYFVYASCDVERLEQVWDVMRRELSNLAGGLEQDDLDRLLAKTVTAATLSGERPHDRMHRLGRLFTYLRTYWPLEEELDQLSRVTLADVRRVCEEFPIHPATVGRLLPAD